MALYAIASPRHPAHLRRMTEHATKRPKEFVKPTTWSNEPPPEPEAAEDEGEELSPTRYGDWERKGIVSDF